MPKPRRRSQESRKLWTRDYLITRLEIAKKSMEAAIKLAEQPDAGKMPKALRKSAIVECERLQKVIDKLKAWVVTEKERLDKIAAEAPPATPEILQKPKPQLAGWNKPQEEKPKKGDKKSGGSKKNRGTNSQMPLPPM